MNLRWIIDPKTKEESISLTLMLVTFLIVSVLGVLESLEKVKSTGPFVEILLSFIALYFGRRMTFKGQSYSADKAEEIKEKVE